jgi:hypothetical protein
MAQSRRPTTAAYAIDVQAGKCCTHVRHMICLVWQVLGSCAAATQEAVAAATQEAVAAATQAAVAAATQEAAAAAVAAA